MGAVTGLARTRPLLARAAALVLAFVGLVASSPPAGPVSETPDRSIVAAREIINDFRRQQGLGSLHSDAHLDAIAAAYARELAASGELSHTGPDGSDLTTRAARAGYHGLACAENLGAGQHSGLVIVRGWVNSSPHRRNLLLPEARSIGLAVARDFGRPVWVMVLGC